MFSHKEARKSQKNSLEFQAQPARVKPGTAASRLNSELRFRVQALACPREAGDGSLEAEL